MNNTATETLCVVVERELLLTGKRAPRICGPC
jgi:hypothetical protein